MAAWRLRAFPGREFLIAIAATGVVLLFAFVGARKFGTIGLLAPLALVLAWFLLLRPFATITLAVGLAVLCEGPSFGLFSFMTHLYDGLYKSFTPLDVLVFIGVAGVGIDVIVHPRPVRFPRELAIPVVMLVLALVVGAAEGHSAGFGLRSVVLAENVLWYIVLLPLALANLDVDRRQVALLLGGAVALAILKAVLGLMEVAGGYGSSVEGSSTLTYYEPAANWLIMLALLGIFAASVARTRPPLWMLLGSPLLVASLVLSYRRSFWIAAVLGLLLVLLLGISPLGRRLLVPTCLLVVAAIWLLGSVSFQSQSPILKRAESLDPTSLQTNTEDRYRLDERANVLGAIGEHPITGLGVLVPWSATFQPLSLEHPGGRLYVHFVALWWWLKLGILGLVAYVTLLIGAALLAWRVWRRSREPPLRAFGLASLCGIAGLLVIETTASFTGVDLRFTVLIGAQIGLLALLARTAGGETAPLARPTAPVLHAVDR